MIRNRLLLLAALLAPLAHAPAVSAQSGRLSVTIRDYDDQTCRAAVARSGADRTRPWWCIIGVARHPQGVAELTAPGARVVTDSDQAGGMLFTVVFPTGGDQARTLVLMARTGTGETAEERYLLTPGAYDPAHPERQTFTLTTTRPRVLGGGAGAQETAAPLLAQADASAPAGDLAQGAPASTQAAVAQPGAAAAPGTVAAAPAAPTEDLAGRHIRITEPREWSAMGTRGIITAPARRSVYVTGFADHPDGQVASVAVDGKPAALTRDGSLRVRFSGFVPVDSVSRDVQVVVYGQNGLPVIGHYQLNAVPSARAYDGSASNVFSSGFRGQRWAVVVGVSEYQDSSITPLRFADDDARAFYDFLRSPRAGGGGFPESHIKLLVDQQATYAEVRSALKIFLRQAGPEDQVIIYFAGHGEPDPRRPSDLYLLTNDTRSAELAASAFPMQDLNKAVADLGAKHILLITDACHSGGITTSVATRGVNNLVNDAFLRELGSSNGGLAVFTASEVNQTSLEDTQWGGGHGVFTYFLLEALNGAADDNHDQIVQLGEAMWYTMEHVRRATQNTQVPSIGDHSYDQYLPLSIVPDSSEMAQLAASAPTPAAAPEASTPARPAIPPALADSLARAQAASAAFPNSAQYRAELGRLLMRTGQDSLAIATLREAVRLDPKSADFQRDLGMALRDAGHVELSLEAFATAVRLDPSNASYQYETGIALQRAGRLDEAIEKLRRAVRMEGTSAVYLAALGNALRLANRPKDAVVSLRGAVGLDAASPVYRRDLSRVLADDGRLSEAAAELREAVRLAADSAAYHFELADLLQHSGQQAEARGALAQAVRLDSVNAGYRSTFGRLLLAMGLKYEATLEFRAAIRLAPAEGAHHYDLGSVFSANEQPDSATAHLQEAVRLTPANALYQNALGVALRAAHRPTEALDALIAATRQDGARGSYQYDLAMMYLETGDLTSAQTALQQAVRLEPGNSEYTTALRNLQRRLRNN